MVLVYGLNIFSSTVSISVLKWTLNREKRLEMRDVVLHFLTFDNFQHLATIQYKRISKR